MKLTLTNIGIIQQAEITLEGLTVIAGENDTGKSTVGKVLYGLIKTLSASANKGSSDPAINFYQKKFSHYIHTLFKKQISRSGSIDLEYDEERFSITLENDHCMDFTFPENYSKHEARLNRPIFIDTPFVWNVLPSIKAINSLESQGSEIDFQIIPTLQDLIFCLTTRFKKKEQTINLSINQIIKGDFKEDQFGDFIYVKNDKKINLLNTAMGTKYFGIFQVLSNNNHFFKGQILILDEPEVHLHPKWQLELAKIIVQLVKKGVKILVNSHSPYMIEALQKYGEKEKITSHFYFSEDHKILEEDSLSRIFAKLSEPFDQFDQLDSEKIHG